MKLQPNDIFFYLNDQSFRRWVLRQDAGCEKYWLQWLQLHPHNEPFANDAQKILLYIQQTGQPYSASDVADKIEVWDKVQSTIKYLQLEKASQPMRRRFSIGRYRRYAAVLAGLVLLMSVLIMQFRPFFRHAQEPNINHILPGGDHAYLQLPNRQIIFLDSVADGIIYQNHALPLITKKAGILYIQAVQEHDAGKYVVHTPEGGRYHIVLPDSSDVWMNAASSITIPTQFSSTNREILMTGECYFDIRHFAAQPFLVHTPLNTVKVLGTSFNISAYNTTAVKISLVRGKVRILQNKRQKDLLPGQKAICNVANKDIHIDGDATSLEPEIAWKDGYFSFKNESIEEVMNKLKQWYKFEAVCAGDIHEKFNGRIPMSTEIDKVFKILELTGSVKFEVQDNKVWVSKK